jgi:hypothetical protein
MASDLNFSIRQNEMRRISARYSAYLAENPLANAEKLMDNIRI